MMDYDENQDKTLHELAHELVVAIRSFACSKARIEQFNQIDSLEDSEIEDLYLQWSEKYTFIAMLLPERTRLASFVDWATMSPIEQYKQSRKGE